MSLFGLNPGDLSIHLDTPESSIPEVELKNSKGHLFDDAKFLTLAEVLHHMETIESEHLKAQSENRSGMQASLDTPRLSQVFDETLAYARQFVLMDVNQERVLRASIESVVADQDITAAVVGACGDVDDAAADLTEEQREALMSKQLTSYEMSQICNLLPEDREEMDALIPSIKTKLDNDKREEIAILIERSKQQTAGDHDRMDELGSLTAPGASGAGHPEVGGFPDYHQHSIKPEQGY
ncbi:hypothetical protein H696_00897 [Fonticula alba]|uniref:RNA polymerase Rpb4/RPC9 core domain-containing protein n=1 Tax=Fonticula alba TaxID=691883 RepID=A0A058ZHE2_FONAL|nr:hypothetical protein H696_00897 [Fonticula alba]KCV73358.1 hypothetical protein H696_00897 [Fonticula alba]|eukprot:XP_009493059.1 hypothetical protein H696_00897 [Fonticula alba]